MFKLISKSVSILLSPTLSKAPINALKMSTIPKYETLAVSVPKEYVFHVELNRPDKLNAMNHAMWLDIHQCFTDLSTNEDCRVIVLSGSGRLFTSGLDFKAMMTVGNDIASTEDVARKAKVIIKYLRKYQESMTSLEQCAKPVIAAVHNGCIGAGVDLISAADMRYCSKDAWFQAKEIDLGFAADVGTLQRLPKIIGNAGLARELCYTGRKFIASEALNCGLVNQVYDDKESLLKAVIELADVIAKKSPVAVQTTKASLVYGRDHSVDEGLHHIGLLNQMMLQSEDFANAVGALVSKQPSVVFSKL